MSFSAESFMQSESVSYTEVNNLKKAELLSLAQHLGLSVKSSYRKDNIKNIVLQYFLAEKLIGPDELPGSGETDLNESADLSLRLRQLEFEEKEKQRAYELELARQKHESDEKQRLLDERESKGY